MKEGVFCFREEHRQQKGATSAYSVAPGYRGGLPAPASVWESPFGVLAKRMEQAPLSHPQLAADRPFGASGGRRGPILEDFQGPATTSTRPLAPGPERLQKTPPPGPRELTTPAAGGSHPCRMQVALAANQ